MSFINPSVVKKRISIVMNSLTSAEKKTAEHLNCHIILYTDYGTVDFGELYTRSPNRLYKTLKEVPSVKDVMVRITYNLAQTV